MKILFLTDNFPPEVNAPAIRTFEHCREWAKKGMTITVITCFPNFPQGKIYQGYKHKLYMVEMVEGIRVIRVWTFISANKGIVRRSLDYVSFGIISFFAGLFQRCDVIVATSPQIFSAVSGALLSVFKRKKFVMEVRDLWPESIVVVGAMKHNIMIRFLSRIEKLLYKKAWKIIVAIEPFIEIIAARGIERKKIFYISNGTNRIFFPPRQKNSSIIEKLNLREKFVVGYAGTLGMAHRLDFILDCLAALNDESLHFLFIGEGAKKEALMMQAESLGLRNVTFLDNVPRAEVPEYLSVMDAGLIHLRKSEVFEKAIPSKMFEFASMGIPVILGVKGDAKKLIEKYNSGICFEPENKKDFLEKLLELKNNSVQREAMKMGAIALAKEFDRENLALKMLGILLE